ncbi:hypothetical protein [Bradyrhizobium sp. Ai1a-2]|uniref:hypothetical protein n=1 Tax=Bradyrhizobium sp. Ai1a-2 TaxID=196490 RepID=UPI0003FF2640|nr:hypothetical protein [Bradyrhizobium sp. Ai1a-2]
MATDRQRSYRKDFLIASALIVSGLAISIVSLVEIAARQSEEVAQATPPVQSSPPEPQTKPAESKPGGERPTTPAPEPARPDPDAQKTGAQPALPPAPAEKTAPPVQQK